MSTTLKIAGVVLLTVGAFVAGTLVKRNPAGVAAARTSRMALYYSCPMHPQFRSDHPGTAPCCGMRLEPVYASEQSGGEAAMPAQPEVMRLDAGKQQLIGLHTEVVERGSGTSVLRVPGRVAADDSRVYRLIAAADGWVRQLGRNPTGALVKKNEVLASYYVKDLALTQQNYLYAVQANSQLAQPQGTAVPQRSSTLLNVRLAADALRSLGMTDPQIDELEKTRETSPDVRVDAPVTGFVLARNISPGQRFDRGLELYRIADIGHVWVTADIFENDLRYLTTGAAATVRCGGREYRATMSDLSPQFDPQSRTMKTRFDLDNPGFVLRPDMFVDVEIGVPLPAALSVPADAVIDSGLRKVVYVALGTDRFEPRPVKTGWRSGGRVQIVAGLEQGERVVVSGNFLLDSESRLRTPATGVAAAVVTGAPDLASRTDPVCGMRVDANAAGVIQAPYGNKSYRFCSEKCKKNFQAAPENYVKGLVEEAPAKRLPEDRRMTAGIAMQGDR